MIGLIIIIVLSTFSVIGIVTVLLKGQVNRFEEKFLRGALLVFTLFIIGASMGIKALKNIRAAHERDKINVEKIK